LLFALLWAASCGAVEVNAEAQAILAKHCYGCHGEDAKAGLRLDQPATWEDDLVVPGKVRDSRLWVMVSGKGRAIMPPSGKLPKQELRVLRLWIEKLPR
jgi:mono/diheme cytochrome c family protein